MNKNDRTIPGTCDECIWSVQSERPVGDKVLDCNNPSGGIWGVPLKRCDFCSNFKPRPKV